MAGAGDALAITGNLFVTTACHRGYREFREPEIWTEFSGPHGGNFLIDVGYVLAPISLTSVIGPIILQVAAVLGGAEGPVRLPPHY